MDRLRVGRFTSVKVERIFGGNKEMQDHQGHIKSRICQSKEKKESQGGFGNGLLWCWQDQMP